MDPPPEEWTSVADALRGHEWPDAINNLRDIAEAMPDSLYSFRPREEMRTFGEVVVHVAQVQFGFCRALSEDRGPDPVVPDAGDRAAVRAFLMESVRTCDRVFDIMTDERLRADAARAADRLTTMMGHTRRETGKVVTYLRLAGIVPPEPRYFAGREWRRAGG